jgi:hypothetical protein
MEKVLAYDRSIVAQETGYWCGPAATQVVLNGRGIRRTEADLARRMGTDTDGTDHIGLPAKVLAAEIPGVRWTTVQMHQDPPTQAQKDQLWTDLVRSIDAGYGVVMNIVAPPSNYPRAVAPSTQNLAYRGGTVYHYVALMGYGIDPDGRRRVWWADSGFPPYGSWVSFEQTASLCPPKGYVAASPLAAAPAPTPVAPAPPAATPVGSAPRFESIQLLGQSHQPRTRPPINFLIHTEEGNASALDLARYCNNTRNQVSTAHPPSALVRRCSESNFFHGSSMLLVAPQLWQSMDCRYCSVDVLRAMLTTDGLLFWGAVRWRGRCLLAGDGVPASLFRIRERWQP